jgi:hypothetical protein
MQPFAVGAVVLAIGIASATSHNGGVGGTVPSHTCNDPKDLRTASTWSILSYILALIRLLL